MKVKSFPTFAEERYFWDQGISHVVGIDEVGVGCFAGPVVIAGVVFDAQCSGYFEDKTHELYSFLHRIQDSKKLLAKIRTELSPLIQKTCINFAITEVPVATIDTLGIRQAMFFGMRDVIKKISEKKKEMLNQVQHDKGNIAVLVDGFAIPQLSVAQKHIVKGDQKSISIAAASIIAKVYRDSLMQSLSTQYPKYQFDKNKGYGTKEHRDAIKEHGLSDIHRASFNLYKFL